jgi:ketosteroid isomerase-like protein
VQFRFTNRQDDAETAFETGIFKYTVTDRAGKSRPSYVRMEALLVKSGGKWRILMERQLEATDEAEWNAVPH